MLRDSQCFGQEDDYDSVMKAGDGIINKWAGDSQCLGGNLCLCNFGASVRALFIKGDPLSYQLVRTKNIDIDIGYYKS